jgi:hypothetical protein
MLTAFPHDNLSDPKNLNLKSGHECHPVYKLKQPTPLDQARVWRHSRAPCPTRADRRANEALQKEVSGPARQIVPKSGPETRLPARKHYRLTQSNPSILDSTDEKNKTNLQLNLVTLRHAIELPGRKSGFRAGFRPDSNRKSLKIGPEARSPA